MPFESKAQQRYLYSQHPDIAEKWHKEFPNQNMKELPEHKSEKKGLHEPMKSAPSERPLHSISIDADGDNDGDKTEYPKEGHDYSHIEDYMDSLPHHELVHAHQHASKKIDSKKAATEKDVTMDDFEKAKEES